MSPLPVCFFASKSKCPKIRTETAQRILRVFSNVLCSGNERLVRIMKTPIGFSMQTSGTEEARQNSENPQENTPAPSVVTVCFENSKSAFGQNRPKALLFRFIRLFSFVAMLIKTRIKCVEILFVQLIRCQA